ncbi:maleylpyruvate isomerase N-terminal domain-containing protein [Streptomyces sp. NPDC047082]|uniref:maleylpyruvate isomerase N-terminal domain-containing protein n=1 Tax=Streptomyces sp. NPDC047082 TaxID=3155259 RepID=UPI0033BFB892
MVGLRATIDDVRVALPSLSGDEWAAPSAATGWSVKDVGTHMADLLSLLMSAVRGESGERGQSPRWRTRQRRAAVFCSGGAAGADREVGPPAPHATGLCTLGRRRVGAADAVVVVAREEIQSPAVAVPAVGVQGHAPLRGDLVPGPRVVMLEVHRRAAVRLMGCDLEVETHVDFGLVEHLVRGGSDARGPGRPLRVRTDRRCEGRTGRHGARRVAVVPREGRAEDGVAGGLVVRDEVSLRVDLAALELRPRRARRLVVQRHEA